MNKLEKIVLSRILGPILTIKDIGGLYSAYFEWAKKYNLTNYQRGTKLPSLQGYTYVCHGPHLKYEERLLVGILDSKGNHHIINIYALGIPF